MVWADLSAGELQAIADAVRAGRFQPQPSALALSGLLGEQRAVPIARDLASWAAPVPALADLLDLLAAERRRAARLEGQVDLVWTGPEAPGVHNRDTGSVMRQLFASAQHAVFLAGYALHGGDLVFRLLAERMDQATALDVRMVLDIQRPHGDVAPAVDHVLRFAARFRDKEWPGRRLPAVFYDPRSLELDPQVRASMHAKCVVIDQAQAFVTSANFTGAAQTKNIEAGVLVRQAALASSLVEHFDGLIRAGLLVQLQLRDLGGER